MCPIFVASALAGLARAYVLRGDTAKARTAYQGFFAHGDLQLLPPQGAEPTVLAGLETSLSTAIAVQSGPDNT
ncbi:MAG: hypothetical protein WB630_14990 [Candidatus Acidiferrales bacterium]